MPALLALGDIGAAEVMWVATRKWHRGTLRKQNDETTNKVRAKCRRRHTTEKPREALTYQNTPTGCTRVDNEQASELTHCRLELNDQWAQSSEQPRLHRLWALLPGGKPELLNERVGPDAVMIGSGSGVPLEQF